MAISISLVNKAKEGDERAIEKILETLGDALEKKCKKFFLSGSSHDDLLQEAKISILKAIRDYDSSHKCTFEHFAINTCATRKLYTIISSANRSQLEPLNKSVSLDQTVGSSMEEASNLKLLDIIDGGSNPVDILIDGQESHNLKKRLYKKLTDLECSVFREYSQGRSYKEIASSLDVPEKCVDNALMRIRKKAKSIDTDRNEE